MTCIAITGYYGDTKPFKGLSTAPKRKSGQITMTDIEQQIAALRARVGDNQAAKLRLRRVERVLIAAAEPEDDASAELRQIAMYELSKLEEALKE